MKKIEDFYYFDDNKSAEYFAGCTPKGRLFANRFDSDKTINKIIQCLSMFIKIFTGQLYNFVSNRDIDKADELISEWETSVKIPEQIPRLELDVDRRVAIKQLVSKIPVYEFGSIGNLNAVENYVKVLTGIDVELSIEVANQSSFPLKFPIKFGYTSNILQFIWKVKVLGQTGVANNDFPLEFPVTFFDASLSDTLTQRLDIVMERIVPAYCDYYYTIS